MIKFRLILVVVGLLVAVTQAEENAHLYVTVNGGISSYEIDAKTGTLKVAGRIDLDGAGAFVFSKDGTRLYAMAGSSDAPTIATLKVLGGGELELEGVADSSEKGGYFSLSSCGEFLAANQYGKGLAMIWRLENGVYNGKEPQILTLEPRAHGANFSPSNRWFLVPATLPNKVFVHGFDKEKGLASSHQPAFGEGPSSEGGVRHPRHLVFHPHLESVVYTTCESQEPGVCRWSWDEEKGTLQVVEEKRTSSDEVEIKSSTSTLHVTPDGKWLFVAVRNKEKSLIVGFAIDPKSGALTEASRTDCEIVPRSFCLDSEGKFLFVAGQVDGMLGSYRVDAQTGTLTKVQQIEAGKGARWVRVR